jgi:hypothetical protein
VARWRPRRNLRRVTLRLPPLSRLVSVRRVAPDSAMRTRAVSESRKLSVTELPRTLARSLERRGRIVSGNGGGPTSTAPRIVVGWTSQK